MEICEQNGKQFFNEISAYVEKIFPIQKLILQYIDDYETDDNLFQKIINSVSESQILESKDKTLYLFYFIKSIFDNHKRDEYFISKIEQIINEFKPSLLKYFSQNVLFDYFKNNKRFASLIIQDIQYSNDKHENQEEFEKNIRNGENNAYICELIRQDRIDDFIIYMTKNNIQVNLHIPPSEFESHLYLTLNNPILIEYAAFFGSIQIFNYLRFNNSDLNENLWLAVIHGRNNEIIHLLDDLQIKPPEGSFQSCLNEAIKCHHEELIDYFANNYKLDDQLTLLAGFEGYNFDVIFQKLKSEAVVIDSNLINCLVKNNYYIFLKLLFQYKLKLLLFFSYLIKNDSIITAVMNGYSEIVQLLVDNLEINLQIRTKDRSISKNAFEWHFIYYSNYHLLHLAARNKDDSMIKILLSTNRLDVNLRNI